MELNPEAPFKFRLKKIQVDPNKNNQGKKLKAIQLSSSKKERFEVSDSLKRRIEGM